jgi:hypothetical protein
MKDMENNQSTMKREKRCRMICIGRDRQIIHIWSRNRSGELTDDE